MATTKTSASGASKTGTARAKSTTAKSTTAKSSAAKSSAAKSTSAKSAPRSSTSTPRAKANDSLVARTGRTLKERPYTSAAIATGAVGVVAAAAAAGAFLVSRRDKSFKEASDELTRRVKDGLASAGETVRDGLATASDVVKDLGQRGADYLKGDASNSSDAGESGSETRTQREIAEEALTLKETGATGNPAEQLAAIDSKAGAISY